MYPMTLRVKSELTQTCIRFAAAPRAAEKHIENRARNESVLRPRLRPPYV